MDKETNKSNFAPRYVTVEEFADLVSVRPEQIRKWINQKVFPSSCYFSLDETIRIRPEPALQSLHEASKNTDLNAIKNDQNSQISSDLLNSILKLSEKITSLEHQFENIKTNEINEFLKDLNDLNELENEYFLKPDFKANSQKLRKATESLVNTLSELDVSVSTSQLPEVKNAWKIAETLEGYCSNIENTWIENFEKRISNFNFEIYQNEIDALYDKLINLKKFVQTDFSKYSQSKIFNNETEKNKSEQEVKWENLNRNDQLKIIFSKLPDFEMTSEINEKLVKGLISEDKFIEFWEKGLLKEAANSWKYLTVNEKRFYIKNNTEFGAFCLELDRRRRIAKIKRHSAENKTRPIDTKKETNFIKKNIKKSFDKVWDWRKTDWDST